MFSFCPVRVTFEVWFVLVTFVLSLIADSCDGYDFHQYQLTLIWRGFEDSFLATVTWAAHLPHVRYGLPATS